ncbi:MAG: alpha/beta hydrolase [Deltaproteobacteria bacterium]|nr:alpha/beta hydrolase [Deltaproteobacteria bacterium]
MKIIKKIFIGIVTIICLFALYLLIVGLIPGFPEPRQPLLQSSGAVTSESSASRKDVIFSVNDTALSAWLYMPEKLSAPVPCIVMGHGFGGTKDMGLETYAIRFQKAGYAVLAFDYRHLGKSEGEPRQLVWIPYQLEDYAAAIKYARGLKQIDPSKIALWGTSMSGGHVIVAAAKDNKVACVSAQCPGLDGRASGEMILEKIGFGFALKMMVHGQRDLVRSWFGLSPHKIPIVGKPGSIACLTTPGAFNGYSKLTPSSFINEVCARIIIRGDKYRPVTYAKDITCPVLLLVCEKDNIAPASAARETEKLLGKYAEAIYYPIGHFDIYTGEYLEKSLNAQLAFFKKYL